MGNLVLGAGLWVLGTGYWILDSGFWIIVGNNTEVNGEVMENRLKNSIYRKVAPVPSSGATG